MLARAAVPTLALFLGLALWTHPSVAVGDGPTGPQGDGSAKKLQGRPISTTAPTSGQVLAWNGTAWAPAAGGSGGSVSLQTAYDVGNTIAETSSGGVALAQSLVNNSAVLQLNKTPPSASAGSNLSIYSNANSTDQGIYLQHDGTGTGIVVNQFGGGQGISVQTVGTNGISVVSTAAQTASLAQFQGVVGPSGGSVVDVTATADVVGAVGINVNSVRNTGLNANNAVINYASTPTQHAGDAAGTTTVVAYAANTPNRVAGSGSNVVGMMFLGDFSGNPAYDIHLLSVQDQLRLGALNVLGGTWDYVTAVTPLLLSSTALVPGSAPFLQAEDGDLAPVSSASTGALRYSLSNNRWEQSLNGGAWAALGGGGSASLQAAYDGGRTILTASAGTPVAITGAGTGVALVVTAGVVSSPGAGSGSERFGAGSVADGDGSAMFGNGADDTNHNYTTGVGSGLVVGGAQGVLLGTGATTGGNNAITEGYSASGSASGLIVIGAFGFGSSSATDGIGIGKGVSVNAAQSLVVGGGSATDGSTAFDGSTVAGYDASGGGVRATAYGFSANAVARAVGVGGLSDAAYAYSVAIGYNTLIAGSGGIAIGPEMQAPANTFVMGGSAATVGATGVNVAVIGGTGSAAASHPAEVKWRPTDGSGAANSGTGLLITTGISGDNSTASGALDLGVAVVGSATATTRVVRIDPTEGSFIVGGNLAATTGKVAVFHGDVDITGVLDPTAVVLSDNAGGTNVYLEAADGTGASVAAAGKGRIRYLSGTGWQMSSAGGAYSTALTAANIAGNAVTSATGTANQVNVSASTGAVTFSLPQSIATSSAPTFAGATLSSPLVVPAGSTSAVSVGFSSDPNTGLYSPGSDQAALVTGGTARFTLSTSAMTTTLPLRGQDGSVSAPALSFSADTNVGLYRPATDSLAATAGGVQAQLWTATGTQLSGVVSRGAVAATPLASSTISDDGVLGIVSDIISTIPDNHILQYQYRPTGTSRSYTPTIGVGIVGTSFFHYAFSESESSDAALGIHAGSTAMTIQTMALSTVLPLTLSHYDNAGAGTTTEYLILDPADTSLTLGVSGGKMGFYGLATPISKPSVPASTAVLLSTLVSDFNALRQALQDLGLISN